MVSFFSAVKKIWTNIVTSGVEAVLSTEQRRRVVFLNLIVMAGMAILLYFGINRYMGGYLATAIADLSAFIILLALFIFMRTGKIFTFAAYTVATVIFIFFQFLLYDGGGDKSNSLWIQSYPLVAIFIVGLTPGLIYSISFFMIAVCLVFIPGLTVLDYGFNFSLRILGSYILIFVFAVFYEYVRATTQDRLVNLSQDLLNAKKQTDSILHNVKEGIFLLDQNLNIGTEYSKALENVFETKNMAAMPFIELLSNKLPQKVINATRDYLEMFFKPELNTELLEEINPLEKTELHFFQKASGFYTKYLEFLFAPISQEQNKRIILCTVKDVTGETKLASELQAQETRNKRRMESLFQIINVSPDMLDEFIVDAEAEIENCNNILKSEEKDYALVVNSIYQSIHAIKGNALLLGFNSLSTKLHSIEDEIDELRKGKYEWDQLLKLTVRLSEVQTDINEIKELVARVMEFQDQAKLKKVQREDLLLNAIKRVIKRMGKEQKKEVELVADNFDSHIISAPKRKIIKDILIQLTRNAISHGIETTEQRMALNKSKAGNISITLQKKGSQLYMEFKDDGRGLDAELIKKRAKEIDAFNKRDLDKINNAEILGLVFEPGFSTDGKATMSSGRGVGMGIIKSLVQKNGGSLKVRSGKGKYCQFVIVLPM